MSATPTPARSVAEVVRVLREAGRPMTAAEIATACWFQRHYAQQLLAAAVREGRAELVPRTGRPGRVGRPAYRYQAVLSQPDGTVPHVDTPPPPRERVLWSGPDRPTGLAERDAGSGLRVLPPPRLAAAPTAAVVRVGAVRR